MKRSSLIAIVAVLTATVTVVGQRAPTPIAQATPGTCSSFAPAGCLYTSDLSYPVGVVQNVALVDAARNNYWIPLLVRYPIGATGPRPVVIWNHGGEPGAGAFNRSAEWGELLAAAGYVVIHPARVLTTPAQTQAHAAECTASGFTDPMECQWFVTQFRYGPITTHYLIDHLGDVEALDPALTGLLDDTKIVVAGHSAGTTTVLANAGAWQQWVPGGPRFDERDDRPLAFLATGVHGPGYAAWADGFQSADSNSGFNETSFAGIDRPFMSITGIGDETGEPADSRAVPWLTASRTGRTLLVWDTEPTAVHETMNIHKCDTPVRLDHCTWLGSAGLAFVDAVARDRRAAKRWLDSALIEVLSSGAIELHAR